MKKEKQIISITVVSLYMLTSVAEQPIIQLVATGVDKAIIYVDGEQHLLSRVKPEYDEIKLIESNTERAIFEIKGERMTLHPDSIVGPLLQGDTLDKKRSQVDTVVLWSDRNGFFYANGKVNKQSTRFLVDTGATTVTFSGIQAQRLNIDYHDGVEGYAMTASGITSMKQIMLNEISIEGITLYNIEAAIIDGKFPSEPLLGQSFLRKLNMQSEGRKMILVKRDY